MAHDAPGGGVERLRAPCGASSTRYASMRGLLGSRRGRVMRRRQDGLPHATKTYFLARGPNIRTL
eukprot:7036642-Prymnesium_polylepis.1